ncbi:MAG: hypothetical protein ACJ8GN_07040 [Longimicrobiaceae bacterium]
MTRISALASHTPTSVRHHIGGTRASEIYQRLLQQYEDTANSLDVSFRELVGPLPANDQSHSVAPYPGRLLRHIPRFLLDCEQLVGPDTVVLDPFCGSGTVLVEARAARLVSWGIDQNPFARLLAKVKTTPLQESVAAEATRMVLDRAKASRRGEVPDVVNIDLWYSGAIKSRLARLRRAIVEANAEKEVIAYLLVCLALTADRCSFRDPRIPVPVRRRDWQILIDCRRPSFVWETFESVAYSVAKKLGTLRLNTIATFVHGDDARHAAETYSKDLARKLRRPSLILTSPPYGAAQKYIRSSSLALGWTGLATADNLPLLERGCIGREHLRENEQSLEAPSQSIAVWIEAVALRDRLRAAIYAEYFRTMDRALRNFSEVLAPGGHLVLIAGSNSVAGDTIPTHAYLRDLALTYGFTAELELRDTIRGRVLLTKRASKSPPLNYETVHVLRKGD